MVVWRGLINSWEKKESKGKREKERYTQLNAEFQRTARRDKKAFGSEQCKETEENSRMGKSRRRRWRQDETAGWHHWLWTPVWPSSGRWGRTGKPGMLQSVGSQRAAHDLSTEPPPQNEINKKWLKHQSLNSIFFFLNSIFNPTDMLFPRT